MTGTAFFKKAILKSGILIRMTQDVEIIKPWIKVGGSKSEYEVDGYP
jgi:hypothetical protein